MEEKLGEESKIVKIIEQAIDLMKDDICVVCGEEGGLTKAKKRCDILKKNREENFKRLEEIKKEIEKCNKFLNTIEEMIRKRNELIYEANTIEQAINNELKKADVKSLSELEDKINKLTNDIYNLIKEVNKINEEIRNKEKEKKEIDTKLKELGEKIIKILKIREEINSEFEAIGINARNLSLEDLVSKINELKSELQEMIFKKKSLKEKIDKIKQTIKKSEDELRKLKVEVDLFDDRKKKLIRQISDLIEYEGYIKKIKELEEVIDVVSLDLNEIYQILRQYEEKRIFYLKLSETILTFIKELIKQKLNEFNELVNKFYKSLYEHPEFREIRIKFDQKYRIAVIDSSGNEVGYEEILNTSARNAVRIAISSACSYYGLGKSEFNLLIIDEPQLYLDSKHKEKFVKDFLPMIYEKCQIILATNDKEFWDYIKQYCPRDAKLYEIKDWTLKDGPKIEEVI